MGYPYFAANRQALRPTLYLDLDDTVVVWKDGSPSAAPGARHFVLWAIENFELRWLTTWCPEGEMPPSLLRDLCTMLELDASVLQHVRGFNWASTGSKLNGVAWLEHLVWGRPFLWIEDEYGFRTSEREFLAGLGLLDRYRHCNVSQEPGALQRLHAALERELRQGGFRWQSGAADDRSDAAA